MGPVGTWDPSALGTHEPMGHRAYGPQDNIFGIMNVTEAAGLGSDFATLLLGRAFLDGNHGLPKDPVRARYWLKKIVDDECEYKHLKDAALPDPARMLRELDQ